MSEKTISPFNGPTKLITVSIQNSNLYVLKTKVYKL